MVRVGLDFGDVRIGVALSDELGLVASPLKVIPSRGWGKDAVSVAELVKEVGAGEIVIGMPRNMNGAYGASAQKVRDFCERLREATDVSIVAWDERLSTVQASRALLEADLPRKRRRELIDKTAAALILQNYLDYLQARG
ncbi:MAG: Holliday junction resolvase RuvX [Clostridia bacterium]|nr:Holliday junction resolvase RuvX [Clostridia bacterium]